MKKPVIKTIKFLTVSVAIILFQGCALFSAAGLSSQGQPTKKVNNNLSYSYQIEEIVDHSEWDKLLKKYVGPSGLVDYKGFLNERKELQAYLSMLSSIEPNESWSVEELLAYYINTYNAYTVDLILENYPVKSIKDINGPWTKAIIPIGNKNLSLGGVENGILRKMNEPRIHFAVNCASFSCPNLLDEAYTASKINEQLDRVTRDFINGDKNEINAENPKLSMIFNWYRKDFLSEDIKDLGAYINKYSDVEISEQAQIEFLEYDWNLNELK